MVAPIAIPHLPPPLLSPDASSSLWAHAARLSLRWDVVQARAASEPTTVRITSDGTNIYVRFDATQHEPVTASQHSDNVGQGSDDSVAVDLWPAGNTGYFYQFQATPNGTHYQSSSENSGYSPKWESHGAVTRDGYTVTMKIPLGAVRGAHGGPWKAQFVRYVHATGAEIVWSYDSAQTLPDDVARAGTLNVPFSLPTRPKPRIALYTLARGASRGAGGSTSRTGADISVPVTATTSLYATLHPDFSNVELDQQSISPSVYQRFVHEVRPFFTQGAGLYTTLTYYVTSSALQVLYTPAIPTPRDGYAIEGRRGAFSFGAFDAIGAARSDLASAVDYTSADARWRAVVQRVAVHTPSMSDVTGAASVRFTNLKHVTAYATYGSDSGSNVRVPGDAQWYDAGGSWQSKTFGIYAAARKVGGYFNPVDGFVFHPGIAGYGLYAAKIVDFNANSAIDSMGLSAMIDRYQGATGGSSQSDNQIVFDVLTKDALDLQIYTGSDYYRFGNVLTPVSQNAGFSFTYHSGLQTNNPGPFPFHGSSATPTSIAYGTGRYGPGRLDTWLRTSNVRAGSHGFVSVAVNDTAQWIAHATSNVQWFESLSYTNQTNANSSWSVGLRKITGIAPQPNGGGNCAGKCTNLSLAYYYRTRHTEMYLSYGDPNALVTAPQTIFKLIFYAGADKGT